ncbi:hypothetical protein LXA43DRAFT_902412 [Ganoderma leucocontextum]|nr:hypothetical protein LXA43DRAFT_902412 [Ganoderma leucocontextum]
MVASVDSVLNGAKPIEPPVPISAKAKKADADIGRKVPVLSWGQDAVFSFLWGHNIPIVIENVNSKLKCRWTPDAFVYSHGQDIVSMIRCPQSTDEAKVESVTVKQFFEEFKVQSRKDVVKVKDWPPSADLSIRFMKYFTDFMDAVPMPSYTRCDGLLNLAAHYPSPSSSGEYKSFKPDLGPKMYIATKDLYSKGSTPLHLDVTSAINILVHVEPNGSGGDGALWHIFSAQDASNLREYLRQLGNTSPDPIHAQTTYLTDPMLADLWMQYGTRPYRVEQRYGDAVFIPAGCPHQVSNRSSCIKIACDFLCAEGVAASRIVSTEFQALGREDILQLDVMIWHCWSSLLRLSMVVADDKDKQEVQPTRSQRKRKGGRATNGARDDRVRKKRQRNSESNPRLYDAGTFRFSCPHPVCEGSTRLPFDLNGVLCHL